MLSRLSRALMLSLLGTMLSCQQPPDLSSELNDYTSLLNDVNYLACQCPQDLGYMTGVECDEALPSVDATDQQCMADALESNEEAGKDYLDCTNAALRAYEQCLDLNPGCEAGWHDDCTGNYEEAIAVCPQLPSGTRPTFEACMPYQAAARALCTRASFGG